METYARTAEKEEALMFLTGKKHLTFFVMCVILKMKYWGRVHKPSQTRAGVAQWFRAHDS